MDPRQFQTALVLHLDQVFYGKAWHGSSLLPSLKKLPNKAALRQNAEGFSAWRIALHAAYWKYDVRHKLAGSKEPKFARKPADFPEHPENPLESDWTADLVYLEEEHELLRQAALGFAPERLFEPGFFGDFTPAGLIQGAAAHDVYHCGQLRNLGIYYEGYFQWKRNQSK